MFVSYLTIYNMIRLLTDVSRIVYALRNFIHGEYSIRFNYRVHLQSTNVFFVNNCVTTIIIIYFKVFT